MNKENKTKNITIRVEPKLHQLYKNANFDVAKSVRMHLKTRLENTIK